MAHSIDFSSYDPSVLSREQVSDIISLFYRWNDASWRIVSVKKRDLEARDRKFMGRFQHRPPVNVIMINHEVIAEVAKTEGRMGGNDKHRGGDLRVGTAKVLVHEVQHANQYALHGSGERFFNARGYWDRSCERDARQFVDEHVSEIHAYLGAAPPPIRQRQGAIRDQEEELLGIAELIGEVSEPTLEDVREELRASKMLNPVNVSKILEILKREGTEVRA